MKRLIILIAIPLVTTLGVGCAASNRTGSPPEQVVEQPAEQPAVSKKVVLAVRTPRHMNVALLTARQMLSGEGTWEAEQVAIVACGGAVPALRNTSELAADTAKTQRMGARISACGLTMKRKGIGRDELVDGVEVVPNGITEIVRLQSRGYLSVEL